MLYWVQNVLYWEICMIFAIECIAACVLFTGALELACAGRREVFVNDYPPIVTDRLRELHAVAEKPPTRKRDILRKLIACIHAPFFPPYR